MNAGGKRSFEGARVTSRLHREGMDDPWDDFAATEAGLVRLATKIIALALPTRMAERETTANPLRGYSV